MLLHCCGTIVPRYMNSHWKLDIESHVSFINCQLFEDGLLGIIVTSLATGDPTGKFSMFMVGDFTLSSSGWYALLSVFSFLI